jgi:phage terminase small subunit
MSKSGPKPRTAANTANGFIRRDAVEPPSELSAEARSEFDRLAEVLRQKGTLERVDLAVLAECARVKALLDRAYQHVADDLDPRAMKMIGALTSQRRGLLRELGLTLQPSRSVVKTNASTAQESDPLASLIRISG